MKIIRRGDDARERKAEWECKRCASIIESQIKDGRLTYDGFKGDCIVTNCPVCRTDNEIPVGKFK